MAAGWGITRKSENTEYTYKWTIEDFDFAMRVEGKVESASFAIPGVSGLFNLVAENLGERPINANVVAEKLGNRTTNNGVAIAQPVPRTVCYPLIFSVSLKSTSNTTKAAGKLEVIKEGVRTQTGQFGDAARHNFVLCSDAPLQFKWGGLNEFYTTGSTSRLNLVANLTIPGKLVSLGWEMNQSKLDLKPLLLDPSYSDIVLKCGGESFPCHKAILAVR